MSDLGGVRTGKLPFPFQDYKERFLVRAGTGRKYDFTYQKIDEYGVCIYFCQALVHQGKKKIMFQFLQERCPVN